MTREGSATNINSVSLHSRFDNSQIYKNSANKRNTNNFKIPEKVIPVNGSFLFFDEKSKRLSDMGNFKSQTNAFLESQLNNSPQRRAGNSQL